MNAPVIAPTLLGLGLLSGGVILGGLVVSIASSSVRFWPHGDRDWTFWASWTAWTLYIGCLLGVAALDWWHWYRPSAAVQVGSLVVVLAGAALSIWAVRVLGVRESTGLEGRLQIEGPYRWTRNPQYVGDVAILTGGTVLSGSWMTAVLALVGIAWFLLAPFAEEPWLRERYGEAYEAYRASVPRFVGLPDGRDTSGTDDNHDRGNHDR